MAIYNSRKIIRESLVVLIGVTFITVMSGQLLHTRVNTLITIPVILILLPPFIDTVGDLASVLSARLTTALHIGYLEPRLGRYRILIVNVVAITLISLIVFTFLGVVSSLIATAIGIRGIELVTSVLITVTAGVAATLVMELVAILVAFGTYRYGWDPDNLASPVLTTLGDLMGVGCLLLALFLIGV